jgi:hypothetical protein
MRITKIWHNKFAQRVTGYDFRHPLGREMASRHSFEGVNVQ